MIKNKDLESNLAARLEGKAPLIQIILGPRQVGKTTAIVNYLAKISKEKYLYASGDNVFLDSWITEQWQQALLDKKTLIIDEIQKIPNWSESIKKHWDQSIRNKNPIKCVLLGSSSLDLQKGLSESLTGRFEIIRAFHWNFELSNKLKKMTLDEYLKVGGYPGSYQFIKKLDRWKDYITNSIIETVITKDILSQAKVKSPALFRQCFYVLTNWPAQIISYNKILGQLQDKGNTDLVKYYIDLFEAAYLIYTIPKYSKNEVKKKQSSPKIISMAPALNTFHRLDNLSSEYMGKVFESLVGAQLIKSGLKVSYWSEGDYEIDYIIEVKGKTIAIEVKSGSNKKSVSLNKFLKIYPASEVLFITKENYPSFEKNPLAFIQKIIGL